jgi:hypothetical protein
MDHFYLISGVDLTIAELLFSAGEQGGIWDAYNRSTLFQDAAGTSPVTASGQPVGLHLDVSGRGNHRTQPVDDSRPQYIEDGALRYLLYDGIDDFMVTGLVDFSATDQMTAWWGGRKLSDAARATCVGLGNPTAALQPGTWLIESPSAAATPNYRAIYQGASSNRTTTSASTFASPISNVLTYQIDSGAPLYRLRINGSQVATSEVSVGASNFVNSAIHFGQRSDNATRANIRESLVVIRGAATSLSVIQQIERECANRIGVVL